MDLRALILNGKVGDEVIEAVPIPEWKDEGGKPVTVHVRAIGGAERDAFEEGSLKKTSKGREVTLENARARLAVLACCKGPADPSPLFLPTDAMLLGARSAAALDRIYAVASRLAGINEADVEELEKNSARLQSAGSGSS